DEHGRLASLDLDLPLDGGSAVAEAPEIRVALPRPSAPVAEPEVPLQIRDDGAIRPVAVFLDGATVLDHPGRSGDLSLTARVTLAPGDNRLTVRATDDQGIVETHTVSLLGLVDGEGVTGALSEASAQP